MPQQPGQPPVNIELVNQRLRFVNDRLDHLSRCLNSGGAVGVQVGEAFTSTDGLLDLMCVVAVLKNAATAAATHHGERLGLEHWTDFERMVNSAFSVFPTKKMS